MMARRTATLSITPPSLAEVLRLTLALTPGSQGQQIAQREMTTALETHSMRAGSASSSAMRKSIGSSGRLFVQVICALLAIAAIHSGDRLASTITLGLFGSGVAACVVLIAAHDRPFTGQISVGAEPLLQVMPETGAPAGTT